MSGEVKDKSAEIKALLIAEGGVDIDERILGRITTPASGPGAGLTSFFLRFDGHRVRLGIKHDSRLKASLDGDEIVIHDQEKELVRGYIEDAIAHCPGQAFITVSEVCIFNCQFCPVPLLEGSVKDLSDVETKISRILNEPNLADKLKATTLTSGVKQSPPHEAARTAVIVPALRETY